jgi:hypothetical protein
MNKQQQTQIDGFPDGYVHITSDDGEQYLVPRFMIPATHQAFEAYQKKKEFNVLNADGGVSVQICFASMPRWCRCRCWFILRCPRLNAVLGPNADITVWKNQLT